GRAAALHGAQAEEPGEQSAAAQPRGAARGLSPHRLRRGSRRGGAGARTVPGQVAQAVRGGGGESGRSGRRAADVLRVPGQSVAFAAHHQRDRKSVVKGKSVGLGGGRISKKTRGRTETKTGRLWRCKGGGTRSPR